VNVYLNDEDVRVLDGLDTAVGDADVLNVLPAMAGGAGCSSCELRTLFAERV
jgi:molybdopterin synthase sulfur carrier subunit